MFDIGFWELALIGLVALVVVGPERLPKLARMAGLWLGRGRRMLSSVKEEIDRELKAEELKQILNKQAQANPLETILDESPGRSTPVGTSAATDPSGGAKDRPKEESKDRPQ